MMPTILLHRSVAALLVSALLLGLAPGVGAALEVPQIEAVLPPGFATKNGDVNADDHVDISDAVYLLTWQFLGGPDPAPLACHVASVQNGDANGDGRRDISDAAYLLSWKFTGGSAPIRGCAPDAEDGVHEDHQFDTSSELFLRDQNAAVLQEVTKVPADVFRVLPAQPIYHVHIHAIRTSDSDGSKASTITASQVKKLVDQANAVFYSAGIVFDFDPTTDFETIASTLLNHNFTVLVNLDDYKSKDDEPPVDETWNTAYRNAYAGLHRGKLLVFFSYGDKLEFDEGQGRWKSVASGGGASSTNSGYVRMPKGMPEVNLLAHEVGHYLSNSHTFAEKIETTSEATARIKSYVEEGGHPVAEGLDALDGDRDFVLDTPPDAGARVFKDLFGECGTDDHLFLPVTFADGTQHTYRLQPDRGLIMSYFKHCDFYHFLSPHQILRCRDALENLNRHHLVRTFSSGRLKIERRGEADAGSIDSVNVVRVDHSRVVTTITSNMTITGNTLKLIVWDVSPDGRTLTRRGEASLGSTLFPVHVTQVSSVNMGLGIVVTAVRTLGNEMKLIAWHVTDSGEIERKGDESAAAIGPVAACRMGKKHVATAARNPSGNLEVILWEVTASGRIDRLGSAEGGAVSEAAAVVPVYPHGLVTAVRDVSGRLKVISWKASDNRKILTQQDSTGTQDFDEDRPVSAIAAAEVDYDLVSIIYRAWNGLFTVIEYGVDQFGNITRQTGRGADATQENAAVRLGTGLLMTASRDVADDLSLMLLRIGEHGQDIVLADTAEAGAVSKIAMCRTGLDQVVTAVRTSAGKLKLIVWKATRITVGPAAGAEIDG